MRSSLGAGAIAPLYNCVVPSGRVGYIYEKSTNIFLVDALLEFGGHLLSLLRGLRLVQVLSHRFTTALYQVGE